MSDPDQQQLSLLTNALTTAAGSAVLFPRGRVHRSHQASVQGTGAVTAVILVEGSNDGTFWETLGTITLSGTTSDHAGFVAIAPWVWERATATTLTGTSAKVNCTVGL